MTPGLRSVVYYSIAGLLYVLLSQQVTADIENESGLIEINGLVRNDFAALALQDGAFYDILENRLFLQKNNPSWNFYFDGRLYLYFGEAKKINNNDYQVRLMRSYVRFFSSYGSFTLGKTYNNLGNIGLFNPFDIDKSIRLNDVNYAREGILALEYSLPLGDLSGIKIFAGSQKVPVTAFSTDSRDTSTFGAAAFTNLQSFDAGLVLVHKDQDVNQGGFYFKGDAIIGLQGSAASIVDDDGRYQGSEANLGFDYSFLSGDLIATGLFYYNEKGAIDRNSYVPLLNSYFLARYYGYYHIIYVYDEFISFGIFDLHNLVDQSNVIVPNVAYTIANGLQLSAQLSFVTGRGNSEFSNITAGDMAILIRLEGKF